MPLTARGSTTGVARTIDGVEGVWRLARLDGEIGTLISLYYDAECEMELAEAFRSMVPEGATLVQRWIYEGGLTLGTDVEREIVELYAFPGGVYYPTKGNG